MPPIPNGTSWFRERAPGYGVGVGTGVAMAVVTGTGIGAGVAGGGTGTPRTDNKQGDKTEETESVEGFHAPTVAVREEKDCDECRHVPVGSVRAAFGTVFLYTILRHS